MISLFQEYADVICVLLSIFLSVSLRLFLLDIQQVPIHIIVVNFPEIILNILYADTIQSRHYITAKATYIIVTVGPGVPFCLCPAPFYWIQFTVIFW